MIDGVLLVMTVLYVVFVVAALVDAVGSWQFWSASYTTGIPVLRQDDVSLRAPAEAIGTVFETEHGKFKLVAADRLLVRQRFRLGRSQGQLRGAITWVAGSAQAEARVPLMFALAFGIMLLFVVAVVVEAGFHAELLFFVILIAVVAWANVAWERRMMLRVLDEYRQLQPGVGPHA